MAYKLETENVRIIENKILNDIEYWGIDGKEAEKSLAYVAGDLDMANAVIKAIEDLGGR